MITIISFNYLIFPYKYDKSTLAGQGSVLKFMFAIKLISNFKLFLLIY